MIVLDSETQILINSRVIISLIGEESACKQLLASQCLHSEHPLKICGLYRGISALRNRQPNSNIIFQLWVTISHKTQLPHIITIFFPQFLSGVSVSPEGVRRQAEDRDRPASLRLHHSDTSPGSGQDGPESRLRKHMITLSWQRILSGRKIIG